MCIAFPGKILTIDPDNFAIIDISGTQREVSLDIVDEPVTVGDYVICHAARRYSCAVRPCSTSGAMDGDFLIRRDR
jgi:hydrogenase assembly chaperone HypC/HupF